MEDDHGTDNLHYMLGEIKGLLTSALQHLEKQSEQLKSIDLRVTNLESARTWAIGAAAAVSAIIAAFYNFVVR